MNKQLIATARTIFGAVLVGVGILGIFLPILPGWILIFVGIELLGIQIVFIENIKDFIKKKLAETKKTK